MADTRSTSPAEIQERRRFLMAAGAGAVVTVLGGMYVLRGDDQATQQAREERLPDGRDRLPPGQRLLRSFRPMGGTPGDPDPAAWRLRIHGEVEKETEITFKDLLSMEQAEQTSDVHCVTGWSVLDARWTGIRVADLARLAGVKASARHVIFESAAGYTTNVPLDEALRPNILLAFRLNGDPLPLENGPPVRAVVPHLYFWKSAKWLKDLRFSAVDEPGYWETRGYHNHGDPWKEERYG